jgi:hypothetical protein
VCNSGETFTNFTVWELATHEICHILAIDIIWLNFNLRQKFSQWNAQFLRIQSLRVFSLDNFPLYGSWPTNWTVYDASTTTYTISIIITRKQQSMAGLISIYKCATLENTTLSPCVHTCSYHNMYSCSHIYIQCHVDYYGKGLIVVGVHACKMYKPRAL